MAMIDNASGVYATLGYNFSDPNGDVLELSADTQAHMNSMPAFIETWQAQDIANNTVGGYFQNPLANYLNTIITVSSNLMTVANTANTNGYTNALTIVGSAGLLYTESQSFLAHTNRLSGVIPFTGTDSVNPYYDTAMSYGKSALYITNQTDAITNTSPIMGSFTSLFIGPQVYASANTLSADLIVLTNAVTANTLTDATINQINSDITTVNSLLTTRQNADITFYANLKTFTDNYNSVKQFSNMGESQTYLINNFIGTPKLLTRLNQ
jgi:hypothetical protein